MRIIAGKFKGRKLTNCEKLKTLRPTTDRNREAVFNILQAGKFKNNALFKKTFSLQGCNFLDLCCGTGAVGLEALSRGAKKVIFVENNYAHLEILHKNIALFDKDLSKDLANGLNGVEYKIINQNVFNLKNIEDDLDVVFLDPPYEQDYQKIVKNLLENNILQARKSDDDELGKIKLNPTILIIEFDSKDLKKYQKFLEENFDEIDLRKYGKTVFGFYVVKYGSRA